MEQKDISEFFVRKSRDATEETYNRVGSAAPKAHCTHVAGGGRAILTRAHMHACSFWTMATAISRRSITRLRCRHPKGGVTRPLSMQLLCVSHVCRPHASYSSTVVAHNSMNTVLCHSSSSSPSSSLPPLAHPHPFRFFAGGGVSSTAAVASPSAPSGLAFLNLWSPTGHGKGKSSGECNCGTADDRSAHAASWLE
jgi:hypothetical protein